MNKLNLFGKLFGFIFLFILLFELISYLAYFYPIINTVAFFLILLIALILSLWKLEYGVYLILAELIIGSKGYLFLYDFSGISISIRLGLYLVVLGVWLLKSIKNRRLEFRNSSLFKWYLILFLFILWGIIRGFLNSNSFDNIFFDFNGWLYFGLVFAFFAALNSLPKILSALEVMLAAASAMILKTVLLLFIFSHQIEYLLTSLYKWVRITGVGEITKMPNNFYRIFLQSHIYAIFIFFIIVLLLIELNKSSFLKKSYYYSWLIGLFAALIVFISYSRSFWLGALAGLIALYYSTFFILKLPKKTTFVVSICLLFSLSAVYLLTLGIINFPWPNKSQFTGSLIEERTTDLTTEAGAASRFQLLDPLADKIKENIILGSGFGTTITYRTNDPRALENNPDGLFTTYAFEWSYLDIWVKLGVLGLIIYLTLLYKLFRIGHNLLKKLTNQPVPKAITLGLLISLFVLLIVNVTTPYLNHPLGIGFIIFITAVFGTLEKLPLIMNEKQETFILTNEQSKQIK